MEASLISSSQIFKKNIIALNALRFKLNSLNQTCIPSKLTMRLTKKNCSDSVIFIEKKTVKNQLWAKGEFCDNLFYSFPHLNGIRRQTQVA